MGKFDKYNKPNFHLKGLLAIVLFIGIIIYALISIFKRFFKVEDLKKDKSEKTVSVIKKVGVKSETNITDKQCNTDILSEVKSNTEATVSKIPNKIKTIITGPKLSNSPYKELIKLITKKKKNK